MDLSLGFFPRWSFLPRSWNQPLGDGQRRVLWLSIWNGSAQDSFDYTGWQVGAAVGLDLRFGPSFSTSFQLGTRWGQFTSLSVSGMLPDIGFAPAAHGWLDLSIRGNYGL